MKPSLLLLCLAGTSLVSAAASSVADSAGGATPFLGFDTRLSVRPVTYHRPAPGLVAFVATGNRFAFFYPTRVVLRSATEAVQAELRGPVDGAVSLSDGSVWILRGRRLETWPVSQAASSVQVAGHARISASLTGSILLGEPTTDGFRLTVRTPGGAAAGLAILPKAPVCLDWSPEGFAAVVDRAILVAPLGAPRLTLLGADERYASATDVLLLDANRLLLATQSGVLVVTPDYRAVVALIRCRMRRAEGGVVQFLDLDSGVVWEARGLDRIGSRSADAAYAAELRRRTPRRDCAEASEASRLEALLVLAEKP